MAAAIVEKLASKLLEAKEEKLELAVGDTERQTANRNAG